MKTMQNETIKLNSLTHIGEPLNILGADSGAKPLDAFFAIVDGQRKRVYPGTGHQVALDELDETVHYVGGNVGFGDTDTVDLVDGAGNWTSAPLGDLMASAVWARLKHEARQEIAARAKCGPNRPTDGGLHA